LSLYSYLILIKINLNKYLSALLSCIEFYASCFLARLIFRAPWGGMFGECNLIGVAIKSTFFFIVFLTYTNDYRF